MAKLALISRDPGLQQELVRSLEGTEWSVTCLESPPAHPYREHNVIAIDAAHPLASEAPSEREGPVLLVLPSASREAHDHAWADDFLFRGASALELVARLERLRSKSSADSRELRRTAEFLQSLIDASVDAIVATDMEQRVVLFNPSAENISGHLASDVVGTATLEDLLGAASANLVMKRLRSSDHGGEGRLEATMLELVDVRQQRVPVQMSAALIYEDDEPSAILLVFADLRDRLRNEQRLAEAHKKLDFDEKQGVLAELAGTAAHELNQPLTSMMAYAELLLRQSEAGSTGAKAAEVLIREAERMAEIVRKIGKITRYETTSYVGHQKIFDLDRAADSSTSGRGGKG